MSYTVEHTTLTDNGELKQYRLTFGTVPEARECMAAFFGAQRGVCTAIFDDDIGKYWCFQPGLQYEPERNPYAGKGLAGSLDTSKCPSERIDFRAADPQTHAFFIAGRDKDGSVDLANAREVSGGEFADWAESKAKKARKGKKP